MRRTCFGRLCLCCLEVPAKGCFGNSYAEASKHCRPLSWSQLSRKQFVKSEAEVLLWPTTLMMETRRDARVIVLHAYTYI